MDKISLLLYKKNKILSVPFLYIKLYGNGRNVVSLFQNLKQNTMGEINELVIIGSGPAGLTAAIYAARAELKPIVIAGKTPGGQLMITSEVENWPGAPEGVTGPDLMADMMKQAKKFGSELVYADVTEVDFSSQPFTLKTESEEYKAKAVIIATGASARWLGLESEERLKGKGVSACATCDGAFFKDKKVFVVGGGDSAMEEANFLTKFASSVTILVRGDEENLRASKFMLQRSRNNPKISFVFNTEVKEILGEDKISGLKLFNNKTNEENEVEAEGLFVAIGHKPNTDIFKASLEADKVGYLIPPGCTSESKIPGVFIAGDVHDKRYRQAVTAAGFGCMAALDAERYLSAQE